MIEMKAKAYIGLAFVKHKFLISGACGHGRLRSDTLPVYVSN